MKSFFESSKPEMFVEPVPGLAEMAIAYHKPGRVKFQGTYWAAKLYQPSPQTLILPGHAVTIVAIHDLTLLVIPSELNL